MKSMINARVKGILIFIGVIYAIHVIGWLPGLHLQSFGITPRTLSGLFGILFAPLLHVNLIHLLSNTVPLFVLLLLLTSFYEKKAPLVIAVSVIAGGLLVWLFGRDHIHVGASGLVYSLAAFLMVNGFLEKKTKSLLISIFVVFMYGGLVWGVFPTRYWISWESHLAGAVVGVLCAYGFNSKKE